MSCRLVPHSDWWETLPCGLQAQLTWTYDYMQLIKWDFLLQPRFRIGAESERMRRKSSKWQRISTHRAELNPFWHPMSNLRGKRSFEPVRPCVRMAPQPVTVALIRTLLRSAIHAGFPVHTTRNNSKMASRLHRSGDAACRARARPTPSWTNHR